MLAILPEVPFWGCCPSLPSENPTLNWSTKVTSPLGLSGSHSPVLGVRRSQCTHSLRSREPCNLSLPPAPAGLWQRWVGQGTRQPGIPRKPAGWVLEEAGSEPPVTPAARVAKRWSKRKPFFGNTQPSGKRDTALRPAKATAE